MRIWIAACTVLLLACVAADAKKGGNKHGQGDARAVQSRASFGSNDLLMIREYYGAKPLPPGIQKQLLRKGTLPPGIAKKIAPFPPDLDRRLPPLPPGVYRGSAGGQVILYDPVARIIYDVADIIVAARR